MTTDAIQKISLNINVDQSQEDELVLSSPVLGMDPYVLVEMRLDDGVLTLEAQIGGEEMSMSSIGHALEMLAQALMKRGDALAAQAKENDDSTATVSMKKSEL